MGAALRGMRGFCSRAWRATAHSFMSVPVYFKILGIGAVVALLFGTLAIYLTRGVTAPLLYETLEERTQLAARSIADALQPSLMAGDILSVQERIAAAKQTWPDLLYVIVLDHEGAVVAHSFERSVPQDLMLQRPERKGGSSALVLASKQGLLFDTEIAILGGSIGSVRVGLSDRDIRAEIAALTRSVLWGLAACATIGAGLALLLTHLLTRPIRHLVEVTKRISQGEFGARAELSSADEIGRLSGAFNQMAEALQEYRTEVQAKERDRTALLDRIVQAQEDERKSVARELHDHLGQSLLALLLSVQSTCSRRDALTDGVCSELEGRIRRLIDDVHRMAWGMRPSILDDYGLQSALDRYVQEMSAQSGLPVDIEFSEPAGALRLPGRVEVCLYRVTQEALSNVVRHAGATRASVVVIRHAGSVALLVEDNGRGFDLESTIARGDGRMGMTGMRERVSLLGGDLAIESGPGRGTTIRVRIPAEEQSVDQDSTGR